MEPHTNSAVASDFEAIELMESIGGHFAMHLARAWKRADLENQRRLKEAFGHMLEQYRSMVEKKKGASPL